MTQLDKKKDKKIMLIDIKTAETQFRRTAVRETFLCIRGAQLRAPLKPLGSSQHYRIKESNGDF